MQLTEQRFDNALLLKLSGRIDRDTADEFKTALQPYLDNCKGGGNVLLLDFSDLQYISSLGFQALLLAHRKSKTQNGLFAIAALQSAVKSVFDVANFSGVIRQYETVEKALAEMSHSAHTAYMQQGK